MSDSIEARASRGGTFLVGRQLFGLGLSLISVIAITRMLGPRKYGLFAIANALAVYAAEVGKLGLDVYLIRHQGELDEQHTQVTQTLYAIIALAMALALFLLSPFLARWYEEPELFRVFQAYAVIAPLTVATAIPIALLDRQLNFRQIAALELSGQITNLLIAVPIILVYRSIWGLVIGALAQAVIMLVVAWYWADIRVGLRWDRREASAQLRYGCGYAASTWIWQGRNLVNPLVVGTLLGSDAVAYVAMAVRLTTTMSFANSAVWRVYMSLLARLAHDRQRMKEAVETGMSFQVLILGAVFLCFAGASVELVTLIMGERWLPVLRILPFIAAGQIVNSGFSLYSSALYVVGAWKNITLFHIIHVVLFAAAAAALVGLTHNLIGYGWAEIVACASYYWIRRAMQQRLFSVREGRIYLTMAVILSFMTLLFLLSGSSPWLRLGTLSAATIAMVLLIPKHLADPALWLNRVRGRSATG